jgi:hypothetical protein
MRQPFFMGFWKIVRQRLRQKKLAQGLLFVINCTQGNGLPTVF